MKIPIKPLIFLVLPLLLLACNRNMIEYYGPNGTVSYDLKDSEAAKADKALWRKTTKENTLAAYTAYLHQYSEGAFAKEAQDLIAGTEKYLLESGLKPSDFLTTDLEQIYTMPITRADDDGDGIADPYDEEPNTPLGYRVDSNGRALDTDKDGVPDGADKELNTPAGCPVDTYGVALDGDQDGVIDCKDEELDSPLGATVDSRGVTLSISENVMEIQKEIERAIEEKDLNFLREYLNMHDPDSKYFEWVKNAYSELAGPTATPGMDDKDQQEWATLAGSYNIAALEAFATKYADSPYAELAKARIKELKTVGIAGGAIGTPSIPVVHHPDTNDELGVDIPSSVTDTNTQVKPIIDRDGVKPCLAKEIANGVLAFNALPSKMIKGTTYDLHVRINDLSELPAVVKEIEDLTGENIDVASIDMENGDTIKGKAIFETIKVGEEMKVSLKGDPEAFNINPQHSSEVQKVDCDLTASWDWSIVPLKKGKQQLSLFVEVVKDGQFKKTNINIPPKIIDVEVKQSLLTQLGIPLGLLLAGIIAFLFYRRRKKETAAFGTTAGLATMPATKENPKSIFMAYAPDPEDEEWTERIYNQLKTLSKSGFVNIWYDKLLDGGDDANAEIFKHLEEADLILLHVSSDFLASDFCDEIMKRATKRVERGDQCQILPIIIRPCLWTASPIAKYPVFPSNQIPLSDKDWENADNAIYQVMREMEKYLL